MIQRVKANALDALRRFLPSEMTIAWRGMRVTCDPRTEIGMRLVRYGEFEEREADIAATLFVAFWGGTSRCVIDVGANIGLHTLLWARALPRSQVFAFEPAPKTFETLSKNVAQNGLGARIVPIQRAVGENQGEVDFYLTGDDAYNSMRDTKRKPVREVIRVPVGPLNDVTSTLGALRVGLLKIDVEGLESSVIAGARDLIQRDTPVLFVEIYRGTNSNEDPERTIRDIVSLGYRAYVLKDFGIEPYSSHNDNYYNYFFLPSAAPPGPQSAVR